MDGENNELYDYFFTGDIKRAGVVMIRAATREEAVAKANDGHIDEIVDEEGDSRAYFEFNGDDVTDEHEGGGPND